MAKALGQTNISKACVDCCFCLLGKRVQSWRQKTVSSKNTLHKLNSALFENPFFLSESARNLFYSAISVMITNCRKPFELTAPLEL